MIQDIDLRALAELQGPERAFLSVFLSGSDALGSLDDRADRVRSFLDGDGVELEHFDENMKLVHAWLKDHPEPSDSLVVFASWALDFVRGYAVDLPLPDLLRVGAAPYIRPLAELQDEYTTFAVVAADNSATRIILVTAEQDSVEERISGAIKNRVKVGGWSQKRYARRRENQLIHYATDVCERLAALHEEQPFERIVLLGTEETLREIHDALPQHLNDLVVGERGVDLEQEKAALVDEAYELFFEDERKDEEDLWLRIKSAYLSDGLGATGPTDVLGALQVGRADEVLVTRDAEIPGTRCRSCENVVHGTPETCQVCGAKDVFTIDLVDEIARLAETTSAHVDFADEIPGLTRAGHAAALLRY